jgi:hypothetical protein
MKSHHSLAALVALLAAASVPAPAEAVVDPAGPVAVNPQPLPPIRRDSGRSVKHAGSAPTTDLRAGGDPPTVVDIWRRKG